MSCNPCSGPVLSVVGNVTIAGWKGTLVFIRLPPCKAVPSYLRKPVFEGSSVGKALAQSPGFNRSPEKKKKASFLCFTIFFRDYDCIIDFFINCYLKNILERKCCGYDSEWQLNNPFNVA